MIFKEENYKLVKLIALINLLLFLHPLMI